MTRGVVTLLSLSACLLAVVLALPASAAAAPLRTAILDPTAFRGAQKDKAFARARAVGASLVRINLFWSEVETRRPADRTDPDDPAFNWSAADSEITRAVSHGLEPFLVVVAAPAWASAKGKGTPGTIRPDPAAYGQFAKAAARRYSGTYVPAKDPYAEPLPRIRYWQAWNEPNRDYFFRPQYVRGNLASPGHYRTMVNRFADAVRSVSRANRVIAGGLAPLGRPGKPAPLAFMRSFLAAPAKFDVWAHHPYTSGGPTHRTAGGGDVSLGDLPSMRAMLAGGVRANRVRSVDRVQFWVTEFSWDTAPPDPRGVPAALHARWTSEALYRMWRNGVAVVTWYKIWDDPLRTSPYQSGFYRSAKGPKKLSHTAFRFPMVAFTQPGNRILVWGRTPTSRPGSVVVQLKRGSGWQRLGTVRAGAGGMFQKTFPSGARTGHVRARFGGETSLGFSLTPPRARLVNPFGCGGPIPC